MNETPWFPGSTPPVRVGVYQRRQPGRVVQWYSYWDGKRWSAIALSAQQALEDKTMASAEQHWEWRGLIQNQ